MEPFDKEWVEISTNAFLRLILFRLSHILHLPIPQHCAMPEAITRPSQSKTDPPALLNFLILSIQVLFTLSKFTIVHKSLGTVLVQQPITIRMRSLSCLQSSCQFYQDCTPTKGSSNCRSLVIVRAGNVIAVIVEFTLF